MPFTPDLKLPTNLVKKGVTVFREINLKYFIPSFQAKIDRVLREQDIRQPARGPSACHQCAEPILNPQGVEGNKK